MYWVALAFFFAGGYGAGVAAFGVAKRAVGVRVFWAVVLGVWLAFAVVPVLLVWVLAGRFSLSAVPGIAAAALAGAGVAGVVAAFGARVELAAARGRKMWAPVASSVVFVLAGFGAVKALEDWSKKSNKVVEVTQAKGKMEPAAVPDAVQAAGQQAGAIEGCACSSGAVCAGKRGGRYCITTGGNRRYL